MGTFSLENKEASARSLEQHPTEPHVELAAPINHQQQSVLQSCPEFCQAEPYNQTQENNTERDIYSPAWMMSMWAEMLEETQNREMLEVAWGILQDLENNTERDIYSPAWMMSMWAEMLEETQNREMLEVAWGILQDLESNTEGNSYTYEQNMALRAEFDPIVAEMDEKEVLVVAWVLQEQLDYTNNYTPPHDVPALEWHQMLNWTVFGKDTPPLASAWSSIQLNPMLNWLLPLTTRSKVSYSQAPSSAMQSLTTRHR
ncbi:unnamed protein product [Pleuronectes platessa]|uniref:Uncharacterized protein n=1 Tax=Pleuronectes platessa TaxID=8262 RepID=A0A9N7TVF5_PLEPL|nr:unnamed protein product [Pleuronectes platessa]